MKRNSLNLIYHEIIGLKVEIVRSPDPFLEGVKGIILWETTRSLIIKRIDNGRRIRVLKPGTLFRFEINGGYVDINGNKILMDPIRRSKRILKTKVKL